MPSFQSRLDGYRRRAAHEYRMWQGRREKRDLARRYDRWIASLLACPPHVLAGADFPTGGVRNHLKAIKRHSTLEVALVPDESAMGGDLRRFNVDERERFQSFVPQGSPAVHSHVMPWMIRWCRRQQERGLTWIHTYHLPYFPEHSDGEIPAWQQEINNALDTEACHADVRLSVSKWQSRYLDREHGITTHYLPNGVDVEACLAGSPERFRAEHGIDRPFLLYVGRNDPVKNPAEFARLAAVMPDQLCVMAGHGLVTELLERDWNIAVPPNLRLIGGLTAAQVQDALAACEALIVTSKREGLPTLVMEAMTHAKPIVVPDEEGCLEAVGDGDFGHIYPLGDIGALAETTARALRDARKGALGREHVLAEYDWRVVAPKLDAIYRGGSPA